MSPTSNDTAIIGRARKLRRAMTDGERKLWRELRDFRRLFGIHVRRQAPIERFVVDFVIHEHSLIIEVDGEHHFTPDGLNRDVRRDNWLEAQGCRILRFNTGEVADCFDGCIEEILAALGVIRSTPTPDPSPQGGVGP